MKKIILLLFVFFLTELTCSANSNKPPKNTIEVEKGTVIYIDGVKDKDTEILSIKHNFIKAKNTGIDSVKTSKETIVISVKNNRNKIYYFVVFLTFILICLVVYAFIVVNNNKFFRNKVISIITNELDYECDKNKQHRLREWLDKIVIPNIIDSEVFKNKVISIITNEFDYKYDKNNKHRLRKWLDEIVIPSIINSEIFTCDKSKFKELIGEIDIIIPKDNNELHNGDNSTDNQVDNSNETKVTFNESKNDEVQESTCFYADAIHNGEFYNVVSLPSDLSVFILKCKSDSTAYFNIYSEAERRVIARPGNLEGCETDISHGGKSIQTISVGIAREINGIWTIETPLKIKII